MKASLYSALILVVLFPLGLRAQTDLRLQVLDSLSHEELFNYNVSINGEAVRPQSGSINLSAGIAKPYEIRISHIGYGLYEKTLHILPEKLLVLLIREENILEEVEINTGYQTIGKERVTGSVDFIGKDIIERSPDLNILNRLEDMTPSISFDRRRYDYNRPTFTDNNLSVRGVSTLNSERSPLVIVDNFPYDGAIENINPNDIESISILKDAAASSIWGARAGNGVIVITTKRGKAQDRQRMNLTSNFSVGSQPDLFRIKQTGSSDFIDMETYLFNQGYYDSQINHARKPALSPIVELLRLGREGTLSEAQLQQQIDTYKDIDIRSDYMDYFYRPSTHKSLALSFSRGTDKSGYYLSSGYDRQDHALRGNSQERLTLNNSYNFKIGNFIDLQGKILFSRLKNSASPHGYSISNPLYPYADLVNNGQALAVNYGYSARYLAGLEDEGLLDWNYRPYDELLNSNSRTRANELLLDFGATVKLLPTLNYVVSSRFGYNSENSEQLYDMDSYVARDLVNRFTTGTPGNYTYGIPKGGIFDKGLLERKTFDIRNQLNYSQKFRSIHELNAMLGFEIRETSNMNDGHRLYGYNKHTLVFSPVDMIGWLPTYDNIGGTASIGTTGFYRGANIDRFVSLYGNLSYTYRDRYDAYVSVRRDASNIFGVKTNNKWTPLWSIGGAWNMQNEGFFHSDILSLFKFRVSYGYSGNVNNSVPAISTIRYAPSISTYGRLVNAELANTPNPSLRWEKVGTTNLGIDFALWKDRLTGSIDLYRKKSVDLIATTPVDQTTGVAQLMMNSADMEGKGVDLVLTSQNVKGTFGWSSNLLLSYHSAKVTKYMAESDPVMTTIQDVNPIEGYPAYAVFSYRWAGLDAENGNPRGYLNGEVSDDWRNIINETKIEDLNMHGAARPVWFGALRNDFTFRNLSLSLNIGFRFKYFFRKRTLDFARIGTWSPIHSDYSMRWQRPGDEQKTDIPSFVYPNDTYRNSFFTGAEVNVLRGDVIRLNDVRLAYRLGKSQYLQNIDFFCLISNVGIIWRANKENIDPATPQNEVGFPRTTSLGLNISF